MIQPVRQARRKHKREDEPPLLKRTPHITDTPPYPSAHHTLRSPTFLLGEIIEYSKSFGNLGIQSLVGFHKVD